MHAWRDAWQFGTSLSQKDTGFGAEGKALCRGQRAQTLMEVTGYAGVATMVGDLWSINRHLHWRYVLLCAFK